MFSHMTNNHFIPDMIFCTAGFERHWGICQQRFSGDDNKVSSGYDSSGFANKLKEKIKQDTQVGGWEISENTNNNNMLLTKKLNALDLVPKNCQTQEVQLILTK